jgi:catechol 2,3-dioxygenase-like lactoylglutathione lyase family enzyme
LILGIDNVGIAARDPERLAAFYNAIGFQTTYRNERGLTLQAGQAKLFIFQSTAASGVTRTHEVFGNPPGLDHMSLLVDDVDASYEALRGSVEFVDAPADQEWGARAATLLDPEGNVVFLLRWS